MAKLIPIPYSNEIRKLDVFIINYVDDFLCGKGVDAWLKLTIKIRQKVGHSTRVIDYKSGIAEFRGGEYQEINLLDDVNLGRMIRRVLKRTKNREVTIEIIRDTSIKLF